MSLLFPLSLAVSGLLYAIWDKFPLIDNLRDHFRFLIILSLNAILFIIEYSTKSLPLQIHLFLSLSSALLLLLTIIKGLKLEKRIKRVKSGDLSTSYNESIEKGYSNILVLGGIGLIVLMCALISGFTLIETQPQSLILKSFFAVLAFLIYIGILSMIKLKNLSLKNAVRMLLVSFIMILVSFSFSNAAINLS
ncbi:MAG: hypothetical protein RI886_1252 [Pseudomonadota bacterium]